MHENEQVLRFAPPTASWSGRYALAAAIDEHFQIAERATGPGIADIDPHAGLREGQAIAIQRIPETPTAIVRYAFTLSVL